MVADVVILVMALIAQARSDLGSGSASGRAVDAHLASGWSNLSASAVLYAY